jgi:hypothetical protein
VPFDDSAAMSTAVLDLLDDPDKLERARMAPRRVRPGWPGPGWEPRTLEVLADAAELGPVAGVEKVPPASQKFAIAVLVAAQRRSCGDGILEFTGEDPSPTGDPSATATAWCGARLLRQRRGLWPTAESVR